MRSPRTGKSSLQAALVQAVTDQTHQGLFATDRQLRVVLWNRWMEEHSGHTASEMIGRTPFETFPQTLARGVKEYYDSALDGRITVISHGLHRFLLPMPRTRRELTLSEMPQSGQVGPLRDGESIIGTVTTLEDVSERLVSEAELRRQIHAQQVARVTAERALRAKDDFLSTLSHEIRTPLNAMLGWARLLLAKDAIDRDMLNRGLHVIERNATAQARLIDDMLDMARIVAGKLRVEFEPVDLVGVVLQAVEVVMPAASAKQIAIRTSLDPKAPRVLGDSDRLQQIAWNLLSNAVKFTDSGGSVDVRLRCVNQSVQLSIQDTGQGISPEFLPYVFERFRQSDSSSSRRHGGLGLGLGLVRELVELHGGWVKAESAGVGMGSTFTLQLPAAMSPEVRERQADLGLLDHALSTSLAGRRVLLVEDETDARELARTALECCGAQVSATSSSAEALSVIREAAPDTLPHVVVSDIGMPKVDGYEFIRTLRSLRPENGGSIPAVTVTGYATPDDVNKALAAGFQMHLAKPVDPSTLVEAVAKLASDATT
jgi:PAS domain S-box-containing protein